LDKTWKVGQKRAEGNNFEKITGKVGKIFGKFGKIWQKLISLSKGGQKVKSRQNFNKV